MAMQAFSASLPMMLYRALDAVMPPFRRIFSAHGLTEQQWRVLRVLWERDTLSQRELAALTLIPAPSLVGVLDRLGRAGLVERVRSDTDRRHVPVRLSARGRALEEAVMPAVAAAYAELERAFDARTWRQLHAALARVSARTPAAATRRKRQSRRGETA
jgi:homoprotocatechuate degradation regulator HpaR